LRSLVCVQASVDALADTAEDQHLVIHRDGWADRAVEKHVTAIFSKLELTNSSEDRRKGLGPASDDSGQSSVRSQPLLTKRARRGNPLVVAVVVN
jgi:hypothetical protein